MTVSLPKVVGATKIEQMESSIVTQRFLIPYRFQVAFSQDIFSVDNKVLADILHDLDPVAKSHRLLFLIDAGVAEAKPGLDELITAHVAAHEPLLTLVADPVHIPGGEGVKDGLDHVLAMQRLMVGNQIDRHSYVVAIGGGAFLDAVGLAAATAHRGIRHIRIPTTVLSQNDSGVGVKNGVNLFGAKNYFGTFAPPVAVINDYGFTETLPDREKRAGLAEAIKVALIRDAAFFEWLERAAPDLARFAPEAMRHMIRRCAELHMHQIGQGGDPFERGTARPLDFGHWSAHRLEILSGFEIRHGEAVAFGIALDTTYSVLSGLLDRADGARVHALLRALGFAIHHPLLSARQDGARLVMQGLREFQEHLGGELNVTLLQGLGTGIEVNQIDHALMEQAIDDLGRAA